MGERPKLSRRNLTRYGAPQAFAIKEAASASVVCDVKPLTSRVVPIKAPSITMKFCVGSMEMIFLWLQNFRFNLSVRTFFKI